MDFNAHIACCSANYQRLHKLLPRVCHPNDSFWWEMGTSGTLQIQLLQRKNYTDTFYLKYQNLLSSPWLADFEIQVKLYHDAQLAEVFAFKDHNGEFQFFSQPSATKLFPYWEKWQMNHLLCDVLSCPMQAKKTSES